ncbi:HotDog domain-containing protein [Blastocladiella britannica]|nr:HotDog domain-containing protein [Blastocladiella britannica]
MTVWTRPMALAHSRALLKSLLDANRYDALVLQNVHIDDADPKGTVQCSMAVEPCHANINGTLHGGMSATLVDIVSSLAIAARGYHSTGVSVDIHTTYLAAPPVGTPLRITASADRIGGTLAFTRVEIEHLVKGTERWELAVRGSHTKYVKGAARPGHLPGRK